MNFQWIPPGELEESKSRPIRPTMMKWLYHDAFEFDSSLQALALKLIFMDRSMDIQRDGRIDRLIEMRSSKPSIPPLAFICLKILITLVFDRSVRD